MDAITRHLLSLVYCGAWAVSPEYAYSQLHLVDKLLGGNPAAQKPPESTFQTTAQVMARSKSTTSAARRENTKQIATISIEGTIVKKAACEYGSMDYAQWIDNYAANPNIAGIVLKIDSGGGMVDGLDTLVKSIAKARESIPVFAFIEDGMCCSAAYYIAAACEQIHSSKATNIVGSIGVMMTFADMRSHYEKLGIKLHEVYANQSAEKNDVFKKALQGDYKPLQKEILDVYADNFINHVKAHRNIDTSANNPFKGKTYMASTAKDMGMIDAISSFEEVLQAVSDSYYQNYDTATAQLPTVTVAHHPENSTSMNFKNSFEKLKAFVGINLTAQGNQVVLNEAELALHEAKLAALQAELSASQQSQTTQAKQLTTAQEKLTAMEKEMADLKAERDSLKAKVLQTEGKPVVDTDKKEAADLGLKGTATADEADQNPSSIQAMLDNLKGKKA
jgi:signal peptide peptidase SppA